MGRHVHEMTASKTPAGIGAVRGRNVGASPYQAGAATFMIVAIVAILFALGVAAWFLVIKPNREAGMSALPPRAATTVDDTAVPSPASVASMTTEQLLGEARRALNHQRLLAPAGNNAFEFYLKVLERQPDNQVAHDALRETFPFGANAAEQAINQNNFAEAQREIDLLAKADPDNYTLTILRSKLDAQRRLMDRQQKAVQDRVARQKRAAEAAKAAKAEQAARQKQQARAQAAAQAAAKARREADAAARRKAAAKAAVVHIKDAVLLRQVKPRYPAAALRASQQGWVEVEFMIEPSGEVDHVHVVASQPHHVFDRAAVEAVSRWRYKPALRNGQPTRVTLRRRIVFTLGKQGD